MQFELYEIASLILGAISLLFASFLLTVKSENKLSNYLIACYLILNTQDSGGLFISDLVYPKYPGWGMFINSTVFLVMPLIYLYILSLIYSNFTLQKKHLLHLIPYFANLIVFIPRYYAVDFDAKWEFLNYRNVEPQFEIKFSYIVVHLQIVFYLLLSFLAVFKYKKLLLENFSNASLFNFNYLFQFLLILTFVDLVAMFKNVFMFMDIEEAYFRTQIATSFLALYAVIFIVLKALQNPQLFKGIDSSLLLAKDLQSDSLNDHDQLESAEEKLHEIVKLKEFMKNEKPYLDPSLTLNNLGNQLSINPKDLSILINKYIGQHFFDFVNNYRIENAMELLTDPNNHDLTVLEVLYEVGFNSKSSFNTAFKKHTGFTPTEYRKRYS